MEELYVEVSRFAKTSELILSSSSSVTDFDFCSVMLSKMTFVKESMLAEIMSLSYDVYCYVDFVEDDLLA